MQHSSGSTDDPTPAPEEAAGRELRRLRVARGWSQEEVAQRMSAYGYDWHQTTVGRVEAAQRPLRLNEAAAMAALFGVPLDRLIWTNPDLTPEEIDSRIEDVKQRLHVAQMEWPKAGNEEHQARKRLDDAAARRAEVSATMSTLRSELEALQKLRSEAGPPA